MRRYYRNSARERARQAVKRASPKTKTYMAEYRKRPEQVAKRALRSRWFDRYLKIATPCWADARVMGEFYLRAQDITRVTDVRHEVDHIVPMVSRVVCGLHVEHNLQILPHYANRAKSNKFLG